MLYTLLFCLVIKVLFYALMFKKTSIDGIILLAIYDIISYLLRDMLNKKKKVFKK